MNGLVYNSLGKIVYKEMPMPEVEKPTDAIIKIAKTTICRTD